MTISIEPDETLTTQLAELSRFTGRAPEDLVLAMIEPTLVNAWRETSPCAAFSGNQEVSAPDDARQRFANDCNRLAAH